MERKWPLADASNAQSAGGSAWGLARAHLGHPAMKYNGTHMMGTKIQVMQSPPGILVLAY